MIPNTGEYCQPPQSSRVYIWNKRAPGALINAAISSVGQGIGFAIPIDTAKDALAQLISTGHYSRAWLGVSVVNLAALSDEVRKEKHLPAGDGVVVLIVQPGPAGAKAGLAEGDLIVSQDNQAVKDAAGLVKLIRRHKVGDRIRLAVLHQGKRLTHQVVLPEQPDR